MTEMTDEEVFGKAAPRAGEMSDADVFGPEMPAAGGIGMVSEAIPEAFMSRLRAGQALERVISSTVKGAQEGAGSGTPTGFEDDTLNHLVEMGIFHDPAKGRPGPLQMVNETMLMPSAQLWQAITRGFSGAIHGAGGAMGQIVEEFGGSQGTANRAKNEVINLGNWAMIEGGMGRFARPQIEGGAVADRTVGMLPVPEDFANAAKLLTPERVRPEGAGVPVSLAGVTEEAPLRVQFMSNRTGSGGAAPIGGGYSVLPLTEQTFERYSVAPRQPNFEAYLKQVEKPENLGHRPEFLVIDQAGNLDRVGSRGDIEAYFNAEPRSLWRRQVSSFDSPEAKAFAELDDEMIYPSMPTLRSMWREDGIHPAEAVHDAQRDAFVKNEITAPRETIKLDPETEAVLEETGGKPGSLSAALTPPEEIPLDVQPASPPSSLIAGAQAAVENLFDVGRDIQMKLAPMARGSVESMATVKDYMNSMRRNAWDWSRIDTDIQKRFTPEQRARMWNAMDEESLSLRLEEPASAREHQGLATLSPEERAAVVELDTRQQLAWLRARDLGMVEGDGIAMHAPRMVLNATKADAEGGFSLTGIGHDLRSRTPGMKHRKHLEVEETERAAKLKYGEDAVVARDVRTVALATAQLEDAIAGRTLIENIKEVGKRTGDETVAVGFKPDAEWFTVDHPSFKQWRPKFQEVDGKIEAVKDAAGNPMFEQVPIYVRGDFEGPLRAAMWGKSGSAYQGMMALKGKTMGLIMNSPMIHNLVEYGRALPAMPVRMMTFKTYFDGFRAKADPAVMHEAIDAGLVPIGKRFFNQDITGVMETPDLTPGRSLTAKALALVPGWFDEAAGTAVKRAIDKAGDFWHNKLLWDRIADLQAGLYVNFRDDMVAKGMDRGTATKIAAHFANRYAGALPKEAMSEAATKVANFMLFSRSFTLGNLGVMKDMLTGLPKDVLAQIERDAGFRAGSIEGAEVVAQEATASAKSIARRKAWSVVGLDIALMYVGNSVLQSAFNVMLGDNSLGQEGHEYLRRFRDLMNEASVHPLKLLNPFGVAEKMSATDDNEPGRKDRILVGYAKDGTAIYARNPVGKIGEEFSGYFGSPLDMLRKKQGTVARPLMQILSNDAGFGRKVYDPTADVPAKYAGNIWAIVKHLVGSQLPEGQITALSDLVKGEGDSKVNALQAFGPIAGVTFSKGAPGGPAVGEMYAEKSRYQFAVDAAMPDIRKQIKRGDIDGAIGRMTELDISQGLQRWYIKSTLNPSLRLSPRAVRDFYFRATPEQKQRFDRARQAMPQ